MKNNYDDIINMKRPEPTHPRMPVSERAKIFSPFAALKGYEEAVAAKRQRRVDRAVLSEEDQAAINETLRTLQMHDPVSVTHFVQDAGTDGSGGYAQGEYVTTAGALDKIDTVYHVLIVDGVKIAFEDILSVEKTGG